MRTLSPLEFWRGVRPSQAAKSRPVRKRVTSPASAAKGPRRDRPDAGNLHQPAAGFIGRRQFLEPRVERADARLRRLDHVGQFEQRPSSQLRQGLLAGPDEPDQPRRARRPQRRDDAELGQMGAQRVDQRGSLGDQHPTRLIGLRQRLLLPALDRNKTHVDSDNYHSGTSDAVRGAVHHISEAIQTKPSW
jgi:hypothetical protein